jgi:hypothetical protein
MQRGAWTMTKPMKDEIFITAGGTDVKVGEAMICVDADWRWRLAGDAARPVVRR